MRLKDIKPGMAIHCKNEQEYEQLESETLRLGYGKLPLCFLDKKIADKYVFHVNEIGEIAWTLLSSRRYEEFIEFSDLIIPELTAEEVLKILGKICQEYSNNGESCSSECPFAFHGMHCNTYKAQNPDKVMEACDKWKADHDKKEPEIETVDICRIIEIQPDGRKRCVHEEDIQSDLPFGGDERQKVEEILKRYCMEHDGEFIAAHEVISRVKK